MLKIRYAEEADMGEVMGLARAMHAESPRFQGSNFDTEKTYALVSNLIASDKAAALVAEKDGVLCGMLGAVLTEDFFGRDLSAVDLVLFVTPEERGGSAAIRLIKEYEAWAASSGAKNITLSISTGVHMERTVCLYEKLGYKMNSYSLIKNKD